MEPIETILAAKGPDLWTVQPDSTVFDAIALMAEKGIGALLVCSKEKQLMGIVSERDYARKVILQGRSSKETPVADIMTTALVTVSPSFTVDECMRLMTNHRIRHLPVLDREHLVGIVSIGDLVNALITLQAHTIDQLHSYITNQYP